MSVLRGVSGVAASFDAASDEFQATILPPSPVSVDRPSNVADSYARTHDFYR
jgi:hypothetical protein